MMLNEMLVVLWPESMNPNYPYTNYHGIEYIM